jgi:hypothetical protein
MRVFVGSIITLSALLSACGGSAPVPSAERTRALADVRAAEEVGAGQVPKAALHLKMARDQIATAERLIADDENKEATMVLTRAQADAEVAIALAHENKLRLEAKQAQAKVQELIKEAGGAK